MKRETYCLTAILGIGVALVAGALFASESWQSLVGITAGILMLILGYMFTTPAE